MRPRSMQDVLASKDYPVQRKGSRGTVRIRGLRDALATQKVSTDEVPATHAQRLSEIGWLEREAERLQRESNILAANQQRIDSRLVEIAERREKLLSLVRESLGMTVPEPASLDREESRPARTASHVETFALEY